MWTSRTLFQIGLVLALSGLWPLAAAQAQDADSSQNYTWPAQAPKKKPPQPYGGGTPIDVIMHNKLWVTPPPMASFVRASRPPEASLDYQPTSGKEVKRPALRNAAQLQQLQDELEDAGAHNEAVTHAKVKHFQAVPKKPAAKVATKKIRKKSFASSPMQITPTSAAGSRS
jgi:hypothetical protein